MKKLLAFFVTLMFTLSACSFNQISEGELEKLEEPINISTITEKKLFNKKVNKPKNLEFYTMDDYYAGLRILQPENYEKIIISDNCYKFQNDEVLITVIHQPVTAKTAKIKNIKEFMNSFDERLLQDKVNPPGRKETLIRSEHNNPVKSSILYDSDNISLASREFEEMVFSSTTKNYVDTSYVEKRYYLRYQGIDTVFSLIAEENETLQNTFDILDYMVYNLRSLAISYDSVKNVEINSKESLNIPPDFTFNKIGTDLFGSPGGMYVAPVNGYNVFAGCFIAVIKGQVNATEKSLDGLLGMAYNTSFDGNMYNFGADPDTIFGGDAVTCTINEGNCNTFPSDNTSLNIEFKEYKDGSSVSTLIIGYPGCKLDEFQNLFKIK